MLAVKLYICTYSIYSLFILFQLVCSFFPCGVKTTHCAIFSSSLFIFSATGTQSFLSVQLETKLLLLFLPFHNFNLTRTYMCSRTADFGQRDGHVTSSSSPSQFRLERRTWRRFPPVAFFLWSGQKTLEAFLLCESTAGNPHYTEGHRGFECVFVAFCCIVVLIHSRYFFCFHFI